MTLVEILLIIIAVGTGTAVFLLLRKKEEPKKEDSFLHQVMSEQGKRIDEAIKIIDKKLSDINELSRSELKGVATEINKFGETGRQVLKFTEELQSFQNIWSNQKRRGLQGEILLENILQNILPSPMYKLQYRFKNEDIVDAVVFVEEDKIIPIDAKFSRDNYNKAAIEKDPLEKEKLEKIFISDLRKRIDEASKYVRISENTLPIVLMFIPADGIYTDLFENETGSIKSYTRDLMTYAHQKNVVPVSPNMLYAFLKIIFHGSKMWRLDKKTMEIRKLMLDLGRHFKAYKDHFIKIGKYLDLSMKSYLDGRHAYKMIDKDIEKITEGEVQINTETIKEIERPQLDEQ